MRPVPQGKKGRNTEGSGTLSFSATGRTSKGIAWAIAPLVYVLKETLIIPACFRSSASISSIEIFSRFFLNFSSHLRCRVEALSLSRSLPSLCSIFKFLFFNDSIFQFSFRTAPDDALTSALCFLLKTRVNACILVMLIASSFLL